MKRNAGRGSAGMPSQRQLRVGELVRHALAETLAREPVRDPDLEQALITVAEVRVSADLRHALAFVSLMGEGEVLQAWVKREAVGPDAYESFGLYEVGDFMWARGPVIRTKKGELSIDAAEIGFLAIGSANADRFHPGMSIDYLARVGDLVAGALTRY